MKSKSLILIDISQIILANIFITKMKKEDITVDYIRHLTCSSIILYKKKFNSSDIILAFDARNSWRYSVFPHYKGVRKKNKKESFKEYYAIINVLKEEFIRELPFTCVEVSQAEGDDIIAVASKYLRDRYEKVWIVSTDKDFQQLNKYNNVHQFIPTKKEVLKFEGTSEEYLRKHIIRGEPSITGDGIPNILSDDDSLINGVRQTTITSEMFNTMNEQIKDFDNLKLPENLIKNFNRNRTLVDFECIPKQIVINILEEIQNQKSSKTKLSLHSYFFKYGLKTLYNRISN